MYVSDSGKEICLCHYPMSEWNGSYRGHLHFYGHIHDKRDETWEYMNQRENAYNVGCMLYGYRPVRLNEIVKIVCGDFGLCVSGGCSKNIVPKKEVLCYNSNNIKDFATHRADVRWHDE